MQLDDVKIKNVYEKAINKVKQVGNVNNQHFNMLQSTEYVRTVTVCVNFVQYTVS